MTSDLDLLRDYARNKSEESFALLVSRYLNLVYSAALRQVRSRQLAEEVAQSVFIDLARNACKLKPDTILTAWLYRVTRATAIDVVRRESRRQLREQVATEMNTMNAPTADWTRIEPLVDEAMDALDETDRTAVLLRYFEDKSLREVGQALGVTEDAGQKRVSRAVERLREFFVKRGVTVGASGLVVVISANAVQAAPAGLAASISTVAALAGTTAAASATATAVAKTIAMTTLQKAILGATLTVAIGTGLYEARQVSTLRTRYAGLQQQQAPLTQQIQELRQERDDATSRLAAALAENERLQSNQSTVELLKVRGELAQLRQQLAQSSKATGNLEDPFTRNVLALSERAATLNAHLEQMPEKKIPELQLLTESDWLAVAKGAKFDTEPDVRKALRELRSKAKGRLPIGGAIWNFTRANNGQLPTDMSQLKPYLQAALTDTGADDATVDAILQRYKVVQSGNMSNLPPDAWIVVEKAPVDKEYDSRAKFGNGRSGTIGTGIDSSGDPDDKSY